MNKYRMKPLDNLSEMEQEVKRGVRHQLKSNAKTKQKRLIPYIIAASASLLALLLFLLNLNPVNEKQTVNTGDGFSFNTHTFDVFDPRESIFIVTEVSWDGQEEAKIHTVEIVDSQNRTLQYESDNIAYQVFGADSSKESGIYQRNDIGDLKDLSETIMYPNAENRIIFQFLLHEQFQPLTDSKLKITYETAGKMDTQYTEWNSLNHLAVRTFDFQELVNDFNVSTEEMDAYQKFKATKNTEDLASLSPMNVARLYWLAVAEGDESLVYAFYTDRSDNIAWSLEDQLSFPPFDQVSLEEVKKIFTDLSKGTFIQSSEDEGYIQFIREGEDVPSGFQLIRNTNGVWQVAFMPMQ